jgi:hypothetical protein
MIGWIRPSSLGGGLLFALQDCIEPEPAGIVIRLYLEK